MTRPMLALFVTCFLVNIAFGDEPKPATQFGKEIHIPSNVGFSTNISPDAQAATVLLDNAFVELRPVHKGQRGVTNQTESTSKVITLNLPYSTDQRSVKMTLDIRGFVNAGQGATARLFASAGDATKVIDLSNDEKQPVKLKGKLKEAIAAESTASKTGDFEDRVTFTVQTHAAKPVFQITLILVVERDTDIAESGDAVLAVDSLDLEISKSGKAKYKR